MLKSVKLLFLTDKRINLPFEMQMNRAALIILFLGCCFIMACGKSTSTGKAAYEAQKTIDDKIVADYVQAHPTLNAKKIDTSGVYYIVIQPGSGNALFTRSTRVTVADTGRLLTTGQLFRQTNEFHPSFSLSEIILGWQLGIPKIKKGGIVRLLIPSRYAYGPNPQPTVGTEFGLKNGLPANAILDFNIQLYDITN